MTERDPATLTAAAPDRARRAGILYGTLAYALWGLFPLYFKALDVDPLELLAHRVCWSASFLGLVLLLRREVGRFLRVLREGRVLVASASSAALLSVNWFVYIWAVHHGRVLDGSLGYFMSPLCSVLLGVLALREALRPGQWLAVGLAALGVAWLTLHLGELPWVGLTLAASFGAYGALRKVSSLGALEGLALETAIMFPLALAYLVLCAAQGHNALTAGSARQAALLVFGGPMTAVPLLLFAAGARRVPLSLVGVLQYISPTVQFLLGVLLWHEPVSHERFIGYLCIWLALAVFTAENLWLVRRARAGLSA